MKIYNSFLIRCWLLQSASQADHTIFEIEHIQTGERKRVASFAELQSFMLAVLLPESETASLAQSRAHDGKENK